MTNRIAFAPEDFKKMCEQAERDHEAKKVSALLERVKRQIEQRSGTGQSVEAPKPPVNVMSQQSGPWRMPSRTVPFER